MMACKKKKKNDGMFGNVDVQKVSHDHSDHLTPHHVKMTALVEIKGN